MVFVKGQSGNPSGRAKDPVSRAKVKGIIAREIDRIGEKAFQGSMREVEAALKDKSYLDWSPAAFCLLKEIAKGNTKALDMLLDRIIGKPMQQIEDVSKEKSVNITYKVES